MYFKKVYNIVEKRLLIRSLIIAFVINLLLPFTYHSGLVTKPIGSVGNLKLVIVYFFYILTTLVCAVLFSKPEDDHRSIKLDRKGEIVKNGLRATGLIIFGIIFLFLIPLFAAFFLVVGAHLPGLVVFAIVYLFQIGVVYIAAKFFIKDKVRKENLGIKTEELTEEDKKEIEALTKTRIEKRGKKFNDISEILFKHDPIGLDFGNNIDEYDHEAGLILEQLQSQDSVDQLTETIYLIFVKCFDEKIAKGKEIYKPIAEEIFLLK